VREQPGGPGSTSDGYGGRSGVAGRGRSRKLTGPKRVRQEAHYSAGMTSYIINRRLPHGRSCVLVGSNVAVGKRRGVRVVMHCEATERGNVADLDFHYLWCYIRMYNVDRA
jgi:hypothetical protein